MAINPITFRNLDLPTNPQFSPINYNTLGDLGGMIGAYRDRAAVGELMQGAIDPRTGKLDLNKAAAAIAASGRDPGTYLRALAAQSELGLRAAAQRSTEEHQRAIEKYQQESLEQGKVFRQVITREGPRGDEQFLVEKTPKGGITVTPLGDATAPPATPAPAVVPATPRPQSALPGGPTVAEALPGGEPGSEENPEEAAPYRVAGPPVPPPQPAPAQAPAVAPTAPAAVPGAPGPGDLGGGEITPNLKTMRQQLATKAVEAQSDLVKEAKSAADIKPMLDDIAQTWEKLAKFERFGGIHTGTGPLPANPVSRFISQFASGGGATTEEKLRHDYDQAVAQLRAHLTGAMNKGQGSVSNYERQLYNAILPGVTTVNPLGDLAYLRQMLDKNAQVAKFGRETEIAKQVPGAVAERPTIERPRGDEQQLEQYRSNPRAATRRAQELLDAGVPRDKVGAIVRSIDPALARQMGF